MQSASQPRPKPDCSAACVRARTTRGNVDSRNPSPYRSPALRAHRSLPRRTQVRSDRFRAAIAAALLVAGIGPVRALADEAAAELEPIVIDAEKASEPALVERSFDTPEDVS